MSSKTKHIVSLQDISQKYVFVQDDAILQDMSSEDNLR